MYEEATILKSDKNSNIRFTSLKVEPPPTQCSQTILIQGLSHR